jgi:hypothetical protein
MGRGGPAAAGIGGDARTLPGLVVDGGSCQRISRMVLSHVLMSTLLSTICGITAAEVLVS